MTKVFLIHGAYGNPNENWLPWLKVELEKLNCEVIVPTFPTPVGQSIENWREVFEKYSVDEETIMVGHSLGPAFILDILEHNKLEAAFFVAGFISKLFLEDFDPINATFYRQFEWDKIKENCKIFEIFHADNDPYVPINRAQEIANALGVKVEIIKNAGHFNAKAGYTTFPLLLEKIKPLL